MQFIASLLSPVYSLIQVRAGVLLAPYICVTVIDSAEED